MKRKFDFDDVAIVPESFTKITTRSEITILDENGMLPLFTAPMDTVVDDSNYEKFLNLGINVCLPRNINIDDTNVFKSLSLEEFEIFIDLYGAGLIYEEKFNILVDIANGHMIKLYELCDRFTKMRTDDNHKIMIGNVANPKTFYEYGMLGVDYIRLGIGGGSGCLTSANTGIHYPMASLILDSYKLKEKYDIKTKIVADGGFKKFDEIIKALCLGADYVMIGGIFNQSLESCGKNYLFNKIKLSQKNAEFIWNNVPKLRKYLSKSFRGMSTKEVQRIWGRKQIRTSEGISKRNPINYKLNGWINNFSDYLKTAMSYTSSSNLEEFKNSYYTLMTTNSLNRYKK